jgi:hypothetical protein
MKPQSKKKFEIIIDANIGGDSIFTAINHLYESYHHNFEVFEIILPIQLIIERGYIDPVLFLEKSLEQSDSAFARFYRKNPQLVKIVQTDVSRTFIKEFTHKALALLDSVDEKTFAKLKSYAVNLCHRYELNGEEEKYGEMFDSLLNLNRFELQALFDFEEIRYRLKQDKHYQDMRHNAGEREISSYIQSNKHSIDDRAILVLSDDVGARNRIKDLRRKTGLTLFVLSAKAFIGTLNNNPSIIPDNIEQKWANRLVEVLENGYWS